jgi:TonB-linked SusC/RagA family outer membrane protein
MHFKTTAMPNVGVLANAWQKTKNTVVDVLSPESCKQRLQADHQQRQIIRVMKLTAIILLTTALAASASGHAQRVTLTLKDAPLKTVFFELNKQTGFNFLYTDEALAAAKKVTISVKNAGLEEVLALCFKDQPLEYTIKDNAIVIKQKLQSPNDHGVTLSGVEGPPPIDITGKVTDSDGNPLSGATVKVKGTSKGTTTNNDGVFVLKGVDDNATLEISFVGYETYNVAVANKTAIVASLKVKPENLDEIVINKGYYTEKQKLSTSNTVSVKAKDIEKQPVNNPLLALVARVPGVTVEQKTGFANSAVTVRIQGTNSLGAGLDPLYVIDGVPYASLLIPSSTSGAILGQGTSINNVFTAGNPLSFLNPNDIESIDVLKDADAISIYGTRGANGVILITTKKGRAGKTKVDVNMSTGWGHVASKMKLMNTEQYLAMRKEGYVNDGIPVPNSTTAPNNNNYDLTVWDQNRYTDWQDVLIGGNARYTNIQATLSGGNNNTQFLIEPGYYKETTVFPGDFSDRKGSLQVNISHSDNKQKFKTQFSGTYIVDDNQLPQKDITSSALSLAPNAPKLFNADGSLNWEPIISGGGTVSTWINPLSYLQNNYNTRANNLISSALLSYKIIRGLSVSSSFGYTNLLTKELATSTFAAIQPEKRATSSRSALYSNGNATNWIIEPQISYASHAGKGKLEALVGTTFQQSNMDYQALSGSGYSSDILLKDIRSASSITVQSTVSNIFKYNALYGRANYNWSDRYIANFTARRDGSSRFGSENIFANFYSLAGAWVFSNEGFLSNNNVFNFGKIRASYGTSGNDQIGEYGFMNLYNSVSQGVPYQGIPVMQPAGHTNPYLQWEETRKLQFGLDLGLLKDRVQFSVNYYFNRSSNLLVQQALSTNTGFNQVKENFEGTIQNKGWELAINTINLKSKGLSWTSSVNFTIPVDNGVLKSFPNLSQSVYANTYTIGKSILLSKRYHSLGVDPATGKYIFQDAKGNPTFSPATTDRTQFVNLSQLFYGGMQNVFQYNTFQLDFTFQFVKRNAPLPLDANNFPGYFDGLGNRGNLPLIVSDRWQKTGDVAMYQRFTGTRPTDLFLSQINFASFSDGTVVDASYLKLTNASFSWDLPNRWKKAARLQNASLFVQGQNLFTIDNYKSLDASTGSFTTLPPLRVVTIGCQISL